MKKSKFLLLTTLSPIISLPFLSASCITGEKADNKTEKDIKINENTDEKNSSETMNDKQKQDKSSTESKMEEKTDKDSSKSEEGKSMKNENTDEKNSSETMNDKQKQDKSSTESKMKEKTEKQDSKTNSEKQDSGTKSEKEEKNQEKPQNDGTTADADKTKIDDKVLKDFKEEIKNFVTEYRDKLLYQENKVSDFSKTEFVKNLFMEIEESKTKDDFEEIKEALTQYAEGAILSDDNIAKIKEGDYILFGEGQKISPWKNILDSDSEQFDTVYDAFKKLIDKSEEKRKKATEKLDKIFKLILKTFEE
ncbi:hypothetical protein BA183_00655 [Mycoplasmopsis bovis]|uniref:variable surface lipoprotein n=1 Tax=Mycoplasmopsis bovis TaxID=28903 RepID=UPI00114F5E54|nr:variable surface lipoprotein [Mycoplasmopsis bovis]TQF64667.1 hypothetical protein BA183_00655 [Mycoplasmopsis bovis]